ncbi:DUF4381 family protein [uncultured Aquimonas sp.]|uniref:DUF4381 family protein n=1 Tax=uncultured Aquimonas sp. TaxID=385483 RepID=UPI00086B2911|nr:DUF4381 family protein [uncultured Aquimonas sp.]ODU44577.1 MAG: hypothetical protein ABS96_18230 [Xanthomonadaceae bacterium SCN 69-123]
MKPGPELRDIQLPPEPGLWPWPPGVWVLLLVALAVLLWLGLRARRALVRRQRNRRWLAAFGAIASDNAIPAIERVAAASELLRRAVRQQAPTEAAFEGAAWRAYLQSLGPASDADPGLDTLVQGPWRAQLAEHEARLATAYAERCLRRLLERWP